MTISDPNRCLRCQGVRVEFIHRPMAMYGNRLTRMVTGPCRCCKGTGIQPVFTTDFKAIAAGQQASR